MRIRSRAVCFFLAFLCALTAFCTAASAEDGEKRQNVDIIFDYLVNDMELSSAAACGVLANIEKESGFRTDLYGDSGTSYGICQWHDFSEGVGRFTNLVNYCVENGLDWQSLEGQLEFLYYELTSSSWYSKTLNYLRSVPNTDQGAYDAAYYWCFYFEIPYQKEIQSEIRGESARDKYWPKYGNGTYVSDKPYEIWKVGSERLNVRTGPDTTYPVSGTLDPGEEVRVTQITSSGTTEWVKGGLGWSVLGGLEYVSGELCAVKFRTNCSSGIADERVRWGGTSVLPGFASFAKYGFTAFGWNVGGETKEEGDTVRVFSDLTAELLWRRDQSVALLRGDANSDGKVNAKDVTALMKYNIGGNNWIVPVTADVNVDLKLNAKDVTYLMKYLIGAATFDGIITAAEEGAWGN